MGYLLKENEYEYQVSTDGNLNGHLTQNMSIFYL
jgi:hypothetical protein